MNLRSSAEDENGGSVGCGESAYRIEPMRATIDAVPVGHRILQTSYFGFSKEDTKSTKERTFSRKERKGRKEPESDRGRKRLSPSPPSEPCVRFSRTRLSSR